MRPRFAVPIVAAALAGASSLAAAQTASPPAPVAKPASAPRAAPAARPTGPARAAALGAPARPTASRDGIEVLEDRLDAAADRVSTPQLLPLLGRPGSARGYRLPGYGVVVVLAPRALPGPDGENVLLRPRHRVHVVTRGSGDVFGNLDELEAIEQQVAPWSTRPAARARRRGDPAEDRRGT